MLKHSYYLSKSKREKEYLTNLDKKLCFMGKLDVFQQFLSIKENKFGKMKNSAVNFLDSIQSHLNCTWSIKEMFSAINSKMTTNTSNAYLSTGGICPFSTVLASHFTSASAHVTAFVIAQLY